MVIMKIGFLFLLVFAAISLIYGDYIPPFFLLLGKYSKKSNDGNLLMLNNLKYFQQLPMVR